MTKRSRRASIKRRQQLRRQVVIGMGLFALVAIMIVCGSVKKAKEAEEAAVQVKKSDTKIESTKKSAKKIEVKKETQEEQIARVKTLAETLQYPTGVVELLDKNPETVDFVEHYEKNKDKPYAKTIGNILEPGKIPLLIQWDERWGYAPYGKSNIAISGCGPTCMAMVVAGLTQDAGITPEKVATFSNASGYIDENDNTLWLFMQEAAGNWNIKTREIPLIESLVQEELQSGHPIICSVTQGNFTQNGHFIVLTGYDNGMVTVNDPFSNKNSEKKWVFSEIQAQISAMWAYSL